MHCHRNLASSGAPQEAAAAAMAVAFVAIPYCMTAVIQRRDNLDLMKRQTSAVEKLLKQEGDRQSGEA